MEEASITLTVYFDGQFYVGLFEKIDGNKLSVCKYVFGAEPKDNDVYGLILSRYFRLKFGPTVEIERKPIERKNPKTWQRKIKNSIVKVTVGTKSQQAIKKQMQERKTERKANAKAYKEQDSQIKFLLRQEKKKEKRKGH